MYETGISGRTKPIPASEENRGGGFTKRYGSLSRVRT